MQEEQTFYPVTTEYFTACLPLLEKYFGITAGYFNKELSNAKCLIPHREGNIVKYSIKEDCNLVLPFRHLECHDLLSLINSYGTITPIIEEALLLVAYCIREQQIDENMMGISEAKREKAENFTIKQMEKTKKGLQAKIDKLNDQSRKDDVVTFEELGVDRIFIDESHYFKNRAKRCA